MNRLPIVINNISAILLALILLLNYSCKSDTEYAIKLKTSNIIKEDSNLVIHDLIFGLTLLNDSTFCFVNNMSEIDFLKTDGTKNILIKNLKFDYDSLLLVINKFDSSKYLNFIKLKENNILNNSIYNFKNITLDKNNNLYASIELLNSISMPYFINGKYDDAISFNHSLLICKFTKESNYKNFNLFPINFENLNPNLLGGLKFSDGKIYISNGKNNNAASKDKCRAFSVLLNDNFYKVSNRYNVDTIQKNYKSGNTNFIEYGEDILIVYNDKITTDKDELIFKVEDSLSTIKYFNIIDSKTFLLQISNLEKSYLYTCKLDNLKNNKLGKPIVINNLNKISNLNKTLINIYKDKQNFKIDRYEIK